jgi:phenylalanyl-tRNA synthetase beta chain
MSRLIRGYLGVQTGLAEYPLSPPKLGVTVDPKLARDESYRPYISCAVLRNVVLSDELIKILMNMQEDLHWALGRDRKLASIGVYDLDTLSGTIFRFEAIAPDGLKFVPLGFSPDDPANQMTPGEILEKHKTGQAYAHLLKGFAAYPLLRDEASTVLSMPPIINSESTRVTQKSTNLFCDVTGLSQRTVDRALNILVTSMKEMLPQIEIEQVTIHSENGQRNTPDLTPIEHTVSVQEVADTIGVELCEKGLSGLLERMGHGVRVEGDTVHVSVPAWRNDVMHVRDLIEDAAIAYGYDNIDAFLVPTFTVGSPRAIEEASATARQIFAGLGFQQVMTLVLTCEAAAYEKWNLPVLENRVIIENPISTEQTMCRTSVLPGMLETLAINKQYDLPQHLFEIGDCSFFDPEVETGAREERFAGAVMIGTHVGYADIRAIADAFCHEMDRAVEIKPCEHPGLIPGRAAELVIDSQAIGFMGEVHPQVLENYGLKHATVVLELSLAKLLSIQE